MTHAATEIVPLPAARLPEFLAFFDGEAFADNPQWRSCYCQFLHVDHDVVDWQRRTAAENRAAACTRIGDGRMQGYLAYRDGRPVGWCNAAPRRLMEAFAREPDGDAAAIGQIGCFVVAPSERRSGIATALLDAACAGLRAQGLAIAAATPRRHAVTDAENHHGPLALYLAAGFGIHRTDDDGTVHVRRSLV